MRKEEGCGDGTRKDGRMRISVLLPKLAQCGGVVKGMPSSAVIVKGLRIAGNVMAVGRGVTGRR